MSEKMCAFPGCKNKGMSNGTNKVTGRSKRAKWCVFHRKGMGKEDRIKLQIKNNS